LHRLGAGRVGEIAGQLYDYARKISEVGKHPPRISVTVVTKEEFAKLTPTHEYVEHLWNIISDYEGQLQQFRGKKVSPDRKEIYDFFEVQYDKDKKKSEIIQLAIKHFTKPKSFIERCYRTWLKIS
jgi:hypothetical protein